MNRYMFWLTGLLGLALILAPFVLGFNNDTNALWSSIVLGAVILVVSVLEGALRDLSNWEYWLAGLAGILAVVAPFVLQFNTAEQSTQMWASIILGAVVTLLCIYELSTEQTQSQ